jgi:hypothetical protein
MCLHHQSALIMEAVHTYETPIYFYDTTLHHIPERCHLYTPDFLVNLDGPFANMYTVHKVIYEIQPCKSE